MAETEAAAMQSAVAEAAEAAEEVAEAVEEAVVVAEESHWNLRPPPPFYRRRQPAGCACHNRLHLLCLRWQQRNRVRRRRWRRRRG